MAGLNSPNPKCYGTTQERGHAQLQTHLCHCIHRHCVHCPPHCSQDAMSRGIALRRGGAHTRALNQLCTMNKHINHKPERSRDLSPQQAHGIRMTDVSSPELRAFTRNNGVQISSLNLCASAPMSEHAHGINTPFFLLARAPPRVAMDARLSASPNRKEIAAARRRKGAVAVVTVPHADTSI
jgi:hypothetical protein